MVILVTGAAGFIGFHSCIALLSRGEEVLGIDCLNDYYDPKLKEARLAQLRENPKFNFIKLDIATPNALDVLPVDKITHILHLAAQAGVRHSLHNPQAYIDANITGHLALLEFARHAPAKGGTIRHIVYASSSSVYGGNTKVPFSVADPVTLPVSLYAATKRSAELMAQTYAHLFNLPLTGLRFFTVYGPWGRPDMAAYLFTRAILDGKPIPVFNGGRMQRDFTYIDDIVAGILGALDRPPTMDDQAAPHRIYNLGRSDPEQLTDFIAVLERELGKKAVYDMREMQPGDVPSTYANIEESTRDLGYKPTIGIEEGLHRFAAWFREYHHI